MKAKTIKHWRKKKKQNQWELSCHSQQIFIFKWPIIIYICKQDVYPVIFEKVS